MKITQSFEVARPLAAVWDLFQDVPAVAACMPGAELTEDKGGGRYAGRVGIKLGPFGASFEGEAEVTANPAEHSGHAEGRALDKKGGSRSKLVLDYRLAEVAAGTRVDIDADVQLSGPIAQFGRTGIITETAGILIGQFVRNVEARLAALPPAAAPAPATAPAPAAATAAPDAPAPAVAVPAAAAAPAAAPPPPTAPGGENQISALRILGLLIASFFRRLVGRQA